MVLCIVILLPPLSALIGVRSPMRSMWRVSDDFFTGVAPYFLSVARKV